MRIGGILPEIRIIPSQLDNRAFLALNRIAHVGTLLFQKRFTILTARGRLARGCAMLFPHGL